MADGDASETGDCMDLTFTTNNTSHYGSLRRLAYSDDAGPTRQRYRLYVDGHLIKEHTPTRRHSISPCGGIGADRMHSDLAALSLKPHKKTQKKTI